MKALIYEFNEKKDVTIEDLIAFLAEFEYIHPFQDGNGRVVRLVVECLRYFVPMVLDSYRKRFRVKAMVMSIGM